MSNTHKRRRWCVGVWWRSWCKYVRAHVCAYLCVYVCVCVCAYVCVYSIILFLQAARIAREREEEKQRLAEREGLLAAEQ